MSATPTVNRAFAVLAEHRYLDQSQPSGLYEALSARGLTTCLVDDADDCAQGDATLDQSDVVVVRGRSTGLLTVMERLEARGILTINRSAGVAAVRDKASMSRQLEGVVPTPQTWTGTVESLAEIVVKSAYPIVVKPVFGDNATGVVMVADRDALWSLDTADPVLIAQPYVPFDGFDVKLYGIGTHWWAVRKPSPMWAEALPFGINAQPQLVPLDDTLHSIARRCASVFGLELLGVDCVIGERGPVVIEVNDFPNYSAVPDASAHLADYVIERAYPEVTPP